MLRPARLIPSGVQGYHRETIATSNDAFAYCSTMALHIFRLKDNTLQKVIAAHERPISAICWCPEDPQLLASCSIGMRMAIWDIENEEEKTALKVSEVPTMMDWAFGLEKIAVATSNGSINFWDYKANKTNRVFSMAEKSCKVLRFHPRNAQKLLCGLEDGSLTVYNSQQQKKVNIVGKSKTSKDAVTDAQWDPLSEDYLLVSFADGSLTLFDVSRQAELHSFDKQAQAIRSLAWAKAQPGNFVSATDRVGLLKLWNVSQRTPLGQIKVGNTGVLCVKAVPSEPNWFVLSFKNSAVGVCDIAARTMRFMSSPGHSETIFDVAFHPKDQDLIGTASYDGYVKLWRISTHESLREMYAGKEQLLYGLAFGPGATKVCCVSGSGMLFIFKVDTGETLVKQQVHTGQGFRCEWNQRGPCYIATGGNDGYACVVNEKDGSVVSRLTHPSAVFGVAWHPMQARRLLDPLESLPIQDLGVKEIASTLACASFVGLVEASQLGYHELMFPLAQTLRNIITHQNLNFPVSLFEITMLEATCTSHRAPAAAHSQLTSLLGNPDLPSHLRLACERQAAALERRSPADEWAANDGPGLLKLAGSHLPSCYKKYAKTSVLTNQLIRGPAFELEDKRNFVSLADALAWVRVNAFSP